MFVSRHTLPGSACGATSTVGAACAATAPPSVSAIMADAAAKEMNFMATPVGSSDQATLGHLWRSMLAEPGFPWRDGRGTLLS